MEFSILGGGGGGGLPDFHNFFGKKNTFSFHENHKDDQNGRGVTWQTCLKRKGWHHKNKENVEKINNPFYTTRNGFLKRLASI